MEARSSSIKDPIYYPIESDKLEIESITRSSGSSQELALDESAALKVPRKFITNWRQACDRTRDKTKDLLKKWRTIPANTTEELVAPVVAKELEHPGWSVHVWTSWVSRFPSDESLSKIEGFSRNKTSTALAPIQRDKFAHFFTYLLDHDRDGFVSRKDFGNFAERLRRFADWSWHGPEHLRLLEVEEGFANLILCNKKEAIEEDKKIDLDEWLSWWADIVAPVDGTNYSQLPFWLKILPRIFFLVINKSDSGRISKKELASFYGSVVGFDSDRTEKCIDIAYDSLTSNGDHPLAWPQYQLVYANFLFGRGPFGPGEHFLGMTDSCTIRGNSILFPIDYSAMNTPKDRLEVYSPHCKSSRRSVIV